MEGSVMSWTRDVAVQKGSSMNDSAFDTSRMAFVPGSATEDVGSRAI